ncbi:AraC family transcriptional regulator [Cellulomonas sp. APG4]|uniref:helix-turn-helix domain-containing protein n=1 Tax=Cellulomonas sp. APG4 TaxID=1538656 RepID=UPI00137B74F3|nr:helix-turn-helix domain-containing protein [Cellulomonas sp. APG4]NCT92567.1 AraC family transcriptional regulator [Cellulomonas sp. APG4]
MRSRPDDGTPATGGARATGDAHATDGLDGRGVLYPTRLPRFTRLPAPAVVADLVAWFWIPEWDLPDGRSSRQHLIAFPASNLVVEGGTVTVSGPSTRASHRDLAGRGWAVGALLRPAAVPALLADPGALVDGERVVDAPDLAEAVGTAMRGEDDRHERAVAAVVAWLGDRVPEPDAEALTANALADVVSSDSAVLRVEDAAAAVGVSVRTAQRLARRYVGLSPLAMIRRRRLQEAAERVRLEPGAVLADVAADLGYADHAHLTRDFRDVLGMTPTAYRSRSARPTPGPAV